MPYTVEARKRIHNAAVVIDANPRCAGVDVLALGVGPHDACTLEATLTKRTCPPAVLYALAIGRLHVSEARPRGTGYHVIAAV